MGCFDIFCLVCGNTCHSILDGTAENLQEIHQQVQSKKKIPSHLKKYYTKVSQTLEKNPRFMKTLDAYRQKTRWLHNSTFLTVANEVIHGCQEVSCNNHFQDKKRNDYYQEFFDDGDDYPREGRGVFVHDDCWNYVKRKYRIELTYSMLAVIPEAKEYYKVNKKIKYGKMEDYWGQDFKFDELLMDSNGYMCESPLRNTKNALRVNKILAQFKLNRDASRKGPAVSATFYPEGTIKYGIRGSLWIKRQGKWVEMKNIERKVVRRSVHNAPLKKIACIGQPTKVPLMIKAMSKTQIEFIGDKDQIAKVSKIFE
jgi:hypothetical protein